ncbi:hypothetical protein N8482_00910 [Chitinophagales bacterium]|nr:hypothetical protein [Chitinophagales bacterium]
MTRITKYVFVFGLLLTIAACSDEQEQTSDMIDAQLEQLLEEHSNGEGLAFFTQPDATDFDRIPQDPNNPLTTDKVKLGQFLFHETALAQSPKHSMDVGKYSCASCHHAAAGFQAGVPQGIAEGGFGFGMDGRSRVKRGNFPEEFMDVQPLKSPSILNIAYQECILWNGQFGATGVNEGTQAYWDEEKPTGANHLGYEGVETQAIAGLKVHGLELSAQMVNLYPEYLTLYNSVFPEIAVTERYSRISAGLAIAAYERTVLPNQAPFQKWLKGDADAMTTSEKLGALLFFGKGNCVSCHSGPGLNNMSFHALGLGDLSGSRVHKEDSSDAGHLGRGGFTKVDAEMHQFKVPQLYNLSDSPFYGHGSTITSLREMVQYKNKAVSEKAIPAGQLDPEFIPLNLTAEEVEQLTIFLERSLNDQELDRYVPESLPSNYCFPNNDSQSRIDLGCE